ncbi:hypothetical protein F4804DRAFT_306394 [Jackrogersella minutella]|nr:hypothetical protein F4804DRAFT_306394 [Jackrogersella minutella]
MGHEKGIMPQRSKVDHLILSALTEAISKGLSEIGQAPAADPNDEDVTDRDREALHLRGLRIEATDKSFAYLTAMIRADPKLRTIHKHPSVTFEPFYFFFYGSLQYPALLRDVCRLNTDPVLKPGSIKDWEVMMWSLYPALVSKPGNEEKGVYWKCEKYKDVGRLCRYESSAYRMVHCKITTDEGEVIENGRIFVSTLEKRDLCEGKFDLEAYKLDFPRQ